MSKIGKQGLAESKKMSGDLFCLTYGSLVTEMIKDYEDPKEVTKKLDQMGFNIGVRLADDYLSKNAHVPRCKDARQIAEFLCKQAIPCYLGVSASSSNWTNGDREFAITLDSNPLTELVQVPPKLVNSGLGYSQIIAGAIRGGLEAVHFKVLATASDTPTNTVIHMRFEHVLKDNIPAGEDY